MTLGFTFYPKDWWASDSFYILNPFERYLYLELLFMMYANDGFVTNDRVMIEARLRTVIREDSWEKVIGLLTQEENQLTHKSVNKRLSKTLANRQNGQKGGRPKKPKKPNSETQKNPPYEIEKKEKRIENKVNGIVKVKDVVKPTVDDFRQYCIEKGYMSELGEKAFDYYDSAGWKDSKGNPVKNWKQKLIAVWFKPEMKIKENSISTLQQNEW